MNTSPIPSIDLTPFREGSPESKRQVAQAVGQACQDIGFLTITGHGVPDSVIQQASETARGFFDLPLDEKLRVRLAPSGVGYSPLGGESLAATQGEKRPADLKESLNISARLGDNLWPAQPAALQPALAAYVQAMGGLAAVLMRIFALALDLPEDYFEDKIDRHNSFLRVLNYPAQEADPEPGQLRAGAHADYGSLTILLVDDAPGGLQVLHRNGSWVEVPALPGSFVVNLGDLMMRWTNDRWVSTLHRVANPPDSRRARSRRQSIAFFHNPNPDAVIACLETCTSPGNPARYPPISAGEFIRMKAQQAYRPASSN